MADNNGNNAQHADEEDHSRGYDGAIRSAMPGYDLLHETAAAFLRNALGEQARVLIVGAGTGEEVVRMGQANPGWRFTAEDPSAEMLAVAREKIDAAGFNGRVDLIVGTVQDVPAGEAFDAATMILVQHFLPDDGAKLEMLREVAGRLRPGAWLFLANMHGNLASPSDRRRYQAWKQRQIASGMSVDDAEAMFGGLPDVVHFVDEERTRQLLAEAGFGEIEQIFRAFVIGGWLARKGVRE